MGPSDQAAFAELKNHHKAWLSTLETTAEIEGLLLCHGTPDNDHTYLLETVEPDGRVRLATRAEITRRLAARSATHRAVRAQPHGARRRARRRPANRQSRQRRASGLYRRRAGAAFDGNGRAACALRRAGRRRRPTRGGSSFRVVAYDWDAAAERAAERPRGLGALDQDGTGELRAPPPCPPISAPSRANPRRFACCSGVTPRGPRCSRSRPPPPAAARSRCAPARRRPGSRPRAARSSPAC